MSDPPRSDDTAPSLSGYPPAFVSLISAFITRAEEAETRAHKALVILQAKDRQVVQLQQRMEKLEKIAVRLEEVMVPPLQLPPSPDSSEGVHEPHPRESKFEPHVRLETLYERYPTNQHQPSGEGPAVHNCYSRCQHLIDGLERSNRQLREALSEESRQRARDHEQYVESLARVTRAVRDLQTTRVEAAAEQSLKRQVENKRSSGSSAYLTPKSRPSSVKIRPKNSRTLHCLFTSLKRKNKKIKLKYLHVCEKFKESLELCGKLKADVESLTEKINKKEGKRVVDRSIQTAKSPRPPGARSVHLLQGRLDAAGQVMARQHRQIMDLQQAAVAAQAAEEALRKRLSRAESALAGRELVGETARQRLVEADKKANSLAGRLQEQIEINNAIREENKNAKREAEAVKKALESKLKTQMEINSEVVKEKNETSQQLDDMKRALEAKLNLLSSTLQEREEMSVRVTEELEKKLVTLKQQFISQMEEAKDRLVEANSKMEELYLGIETFLRLLSRLHTTSTPRLSRSSQASAVQAASHILDISPEQIQDLLISYRQDNSLINNWIKECNRLVKNNVFASDLGHFLLEAVLETRHTR